MTSTTVSQFKNLFPASATPSKRKIDLLRILKIHIKWGDSTLSDLIELVGNPSYRLSRVHDVSDSPLSGSRMFQVHNNYERCLAQTGFHPEGGGGEASPPICSASPLKI